MQLVDAQQARRVLDRLVGYKLSPVLWKKVRRGLSAGRVQSVALRLVVEREREIQAFKPEEYWRILVALKNVQGSMFNVQLTELDSQKVEVKNGERAKGVENELRQASYQVGSIEKKEFLRTPAAPFTTSTLQQAAANRMGWSAKKTMQVAQSLYEGGFITYHRTDSTNIALEAASTVREFIVQSYGKEYALDKPRFFKTKSKLVQEAHEAIRPTEVKVQDSRLNTQLNKDQSKLNELIWKRFVACQMAEARGVTVTVTVTGKTGEKTYVLTARGETINFDGWMKLYNSKLKDQNSESNGEFGNFEENQLPELGEGEKLNFVDLTSEQKFTQPPARYNDASLIRALEEQGIGRPSTYAPTLSTIQDRLYVERVEIGDKHQKRFKPTALGEAVSDFLVSNFPKIVDFGFTAQMEDQLDDIASGARQWQPVVSDFYGPFAKTLETAAETAARVKVEVELTGDKCPKCQQGDVVIRMGRFGKFLACSRYPECDFKESYVEKINVACPKCHDGQVIVKRTKSRKTFYGCSNWPKCDFASWTKPKAGVGSQ
jgi:DNA topoisomerase-1